MQPVSRLAPARPHARVAVTTTCQARATASRGCARPPCVVGAPAPRQPRLGLRARATPCGGGAAEPVEAREDAEPAGLAPEELEVLEAAAIAGEDEGRRPTDYDRRAHIFEESSRVFRELKHRRDGGSGHGDVTAGATAGTREQQQQVV
ncbi:hypothetical protein GQ55_9G486700 [Panicum hallii var. hallii]|uniref:Uncharacterized protein n=1 Tax=Panicum hallii var. hallii TaxID=1504633 RepID=A0A2T7CCZ8_9POAL|nr:hypothetical protein GQ55_9G486700 [Panicum hallii var. hallii]